jgi:hypothetical protein
MRTLACFLVLLPVISISQIPSTIPIRGRAVAVQAVHFSLNDSIQIQILVLVSETQDRADKIVSIRYSIPSSRFDKWFKEISSLNTFAVRSQPIEPLQLKEFLIVSEPQGNGDNIVSRVMVWKSIGKYDINTLPYGKSIESYQSSEWDHPIV